MTLDFATLVTRTGRGVSQEAGVPAQGRGCRPCLDTGGRVLGLKCRQRSGMQGPVSVAAGPHPKAQAFQTGIWDMAARELGWGGGM